jgi:hypothetical protein
VVVQSTSIIECENGPLSPSEIFQKIRFSLQAAASLEQPILSTLARLALAAGFYQHAVPKARGAHARPRPALIQSLKFSSKVIRDGGALQDKQRSWHSFLAGNQSDNLENSQVRAKVQ